MTPIEAVTVYTLLTADLYASLESISGPAAETRLRRSRDNGELDRYRVGSVTCFVLSSEARKTVGISAKRWSHHGLVEALVLSIALISRGITPFTKTTFGEFCVGAARAHGLSISSPHPTRHFLASSRIERVLLEKQRQFSAATYAKSLAKRVQVLHQTDWGDFVEHGRYGVTVISPVPRPDLQRAVRRLQIGVPVTCWVEPTLQLAWKDPGP